MPGIYKASNFGKWATHLSVLNADCPLMNPLAPGMNPFITIWTEVKNNKTFNK